MIVYRSRVQAYRTAERAASSQVAGIGSYKGYESQKCWLLIAKSISLVQAVGGNRSQAAIDYSPQESSLQRWMRREWIAPYWFHHAPILRPPIVTQLMSHDNGRSDLP
jgi:hypothetical protein